MAKILKGCREAGLQVLQKAIRLDREEDSFYVMKIVSISDMRPCEDPSE